VLAFVSALGNFGIPALLGIPGRYTTLPVLIWQRLSSFGPTMLADLAVLAALMALIAIVVIAVQMMLSARSRSALIGPPQPPLHLELGRLRWLAEAGMVLLVAVTLALPMASLFGTALVITYGLPLTFETMTSANFEQVLLRQSVTLRAFANSTIAAGLAALVLAGLATILARLSTVSHNARRRVGIGLTALAEITYAIPGIVISIAFILTFLKPLPILDVSLYNTLWIIVLAYLCAFFAVALKPVSAACLQLDPALDEAARVSGANWGRRMRRVYLPLVAPAAASGAILVFLTAYNEVTVSALLWSTGTETIGTVIYNYENGGYTTLAAAMAGVTVLATVCLMVLLDLFGAACRPALCPGGCDPSFGQEPAIRNTQRQFIAHLRAPRQVQEDGVGEAIDRQFRLPIAAAIKRRRNTPCQRAPLSLRRDDQILGPEQCQSRPVCPTLPLAQAPVARPKTHHHLSR
jgi:iron(III) transport system permease protein